MKNKIKRVYEILNDEFLKMLHETSIGYNVKEETELFAIFKQGFYAGYRAKNKKKNGGKVPRPI